MVLSEDLAVSVRGILEMLVLCFASLPCSVHFGFHIVLKADETFGVRANRVIVLLAMLIIGFAVTVDIFFLFSSRSVFPRSF